MKKVLFLVIAALLLGGVHFVISQTGIGKPVVLDTARPKISVVASIYPLADFASHVGGEHVDVVTITPSGAEPHDYEPTPQDLVKVHRANIILSNGNGLDAWADKLKDELTSKGILFLRMSDYVESASTTVADSETGPLDPHFWLDPVHAGREVELIAEALMQAEPAHAQAFAQNRDIYLQQLHALDQHYRDGLARCEQKEIITSHNAFQYLSHRYGFSSRFIQGLSPEDDPSPQKMAELIRLAKSDHIQYIFFETLVHPKLAQTIANEVGAKTLVLNPIEGRTTDEMRAGKDYIHLMEDNLINLRRALVCQ